MSGSIQEKTDKARKAYNDEMTAVLRYEQHEMHKLRAHKMLAEKHLKDECDKRHASIMHNVNTAKRAAVDRHNKVSRDIMRDFDKHGGANAHTKREGSYNSNVPRREAPYPPRRAPYMPPPRDAPYMPPPREANTDFKEEYERTERGYFYRVLGLAPGSSQEAVRKAFNKKILIYHPDKSNRHGNSHEYNRYMFKVLMEAKKILGDTNSTKNKDEYDNYGNESNWIKDVKGVFENNCYDLGEYNPYKVMP